MADALQFPFTIMNQALGDTSSLPLLPLTLTHQQRDLSSMGLLDTGAMVNVLPYQVGLQLGAVWEQQTIPVRLTGNLARYEARGLIVSAIVASFATVRLAFAWAATNDVPIILGQTNFFREFDVCFFRSRSIFEIKPKI